MRYLRQNTAITVVIGPLVDFADGKTRLTDNDDFAPSTDLLCELVKVSTSSELTLSKSGGDNDCNLTGNGLATLELTAGNTDTLGQLRLFLCDADSGGYPTETILPFSEDFMVLPANVYDSLFSTDKLQVDLVQVNGTAQVIGDFKADVSGLSTFNNTSDSVIVGTNNDKTGYSISGTKQTLDALNDIDGSSVTVNNPNDCKADVSALATQVTADFIKNVLEGDAEVDTTADPWQLVIKNKTSGAELIRKDLKDVNGTGITSITKIIGQHKEPS